jgi:hypothetical protein
MTIDLNLTNENPKQRLAIYQGGTFESLFILHPSDLTGWGIRGQVRSNYLQNAGIVYADFVFAPLVFAPTVVNLLTVNRTTIQPIIPAAVTKLIPLTRPVSEDEPAKVGKHYWVYDLELIEPIGSRIIKLARGLVACIPEVTAP